MRQFLSSYLSRFSSLAGPLVTCGPVLSWLEVDQLVLSILITSHIYIIYILTNVTNNMSPVIYLRETQIQIHLSCVQVDNRGNRLIVTDDSDINTPAVAAAYAIKRYSKQAQDEISFEVGKCLVGRIWLC